MSEEKKSSVPSLEEIAGSMGEYEFKIRELIIAPRIEVHRNGKLVRLIEDSVIRRFAGTLNPEYGDRFIADLEADATAGFIEVMNKRKEEPKQIAEGSNADQ